MIFHDWVSTELITGLSPLAWYQYTPAVSGHEIIYDSIGDMHIQTGGTPPVLTEDVVNGHPAWYFDGASDPLVWNGSATIGHGFVFASQEDATFDGYQGLLSAPTIGDVLVGQTGANKFFDLGLSGFEYTRSGTLYDDSNQLAPVSGNFALMEVSSTVGIGMNGIQVGQQRDFVDRRWKGHFAEMILFDRVLTAVELRRVRLYFNIKFGEWARGLPFYFPSAEIVPTVGPSRFYDMPPDYDSITDTWEYEDGVKDFNEVADEAPKFWEYAYPGVPKEHLPIYNEFWNQARLVNTFNFRDPEGIIWDNVRVDNYNRNHPAHMRWRHDVAFRLVGYNSTGTPEPVPPTPEYLLSDDGDFLLSEEGASLLGG